MKQQPEVTVGDKGGRWLARCFGVKKEQTGKPPGKTARVDDHPARRQHGPRSPLSAVHLDGLKAEEQEPCRDLVCDSSRVDSE